MSNGQRSGAGSATATGAEALDEIKAGIEDTIATAGETGQEALGRAGEVRDSLAAFIQDSIRTRPYTTLAVAGLLGFIYGATRR
jgi:hypothetical protein